MLRSKSWLLQVYSCLYHFSSLRASRWTAWGYEGFQSNWTSCVGWLPKCLSSSWKLYLWSLVFPEHLLLWCLSSLALSQNMFMRIVWTFHLGWNFQFSTLFCFQTFWGEPCSSLSPFALCKAQNSPFWRGTATFHAWEDCSIL